MGVPGLDLELGFELDEEKKKWIIIGGGALLLILIAAFFFLPSGPAEKSFTLKVVDVSGNPIEGAEVTVQYPDGSIDVFYTDQDGEVTFTAPEGSKIVGVSKEGYTAEEVPPFGGIVELKPLEKSIVITVQDSKGCPLSDVSVSILVNGLPKLNLTINQRKTLDVNFAGPGDSITFIFSKPGYQEKRVDTTYDSLTDILVSLEPVGPKTVTGSLLVVVHSDKPFQGIAELSRPEVAESEFSAPIDGGIAKFKSIPAGKYVLRIFTVDDTPLGEWNVEINAGESKFEVNVSIPEAFETVIKVVAGDTNAPVEGAKVTVEGKTTVLRETDENGEVTLSLPAGKYKVTAAAPGYKVVTKEVPAGGEVTIILPPAIEYYTLKVRVLDVLGRPVPGASVYLLSTEKKSVWTGQTDGDGVAVIEKLPRGSYAVVAAKDNISESKIVDLMGDTTIDLTLYPEKASLHLLTLLSGVPVSAEVEVWVGDSLFTTFTTDLSGEGETTIPALYPVVLKVYYPDFVYISPEFVLTPDESKDMKIDVDERIKFPSVKLLGTYVDETQVDGIQAGGETRLLVRFALNDGEALAALLTHQGITHLSAEGWESAGWEAAPPQNLAEAVDAALSSSAQGDAIVRSSFDGKVVVDQYITVKVPDIEGILRILLAAKDSGGIEATAKAFKIGEPANCVNDFCYTVRLTDSLGEEVTELSSGENYTVEVNLTYTGDDMLAADVVLSYKDDEQKTSTSSELTFLPGDTKTFILPFKAGRGAGIAHLSVQQEGISLFDQDLFILPVKEENLEENAPSLSLSVSPTTALAYPVPQTFSLDFEKIKGALLTIYKVIDGKEIAVRTRRPRSKITISPGADWEAIIFELTAPGYEPARVTVELKSVEAFVQPEETVDADLSDGEANITYTIDATVPTTVSVSYDDTQLRACGTDVSVSPKILVLDGNSPGEVTVSFKKNSDKCVAPRELRLSFTLSIENRRAFTFSRTINVLPAGSCIAIDPVNTQLDPENNSITLTLHVQDPTCGDVEVNFPCEEQYILGAEDQKLCVYDDGEVKLIFPQKTVKLSDNYSTSVEVRPSEETENKPMWVADISLPISYKAHNAEGTVHAQLHIQYINRSNCFSVKDVQTEYTKKGVKVALTVSQSEMCAYQVKTLKLSIKTAKGSATSSRSDVEIPGGKEEDVTFTIPYDKFSVGELLEGASSDASLEINVGRTTFAYPVKIKLPGVDQPYTCELYSSSQGEENYVFLECSSNVEFDLPMLVNIPENVYLVDNKGVFVNQHSIDFTLQPEIPEKIKLFPVCPENIEEEGKIGTIRISIEGVEGFEELDIKVCNNTKPAVYASLPKLDNAVVDLSWLALADRTCTGSGAGATECVREIDLLNGTITYHLDKLQMSDTELARLCAEKWCEYGLFKEIKEKLVKDGYLGNVVDELTFSVVTDVPYGFARITVKTNEIVYNPAYTRTKEITKYELLAELLPRILLAHARYKAFDSQKDNKPLQDAILEFSNLESKPPMPVFVYMGENVALYTEKINIYSLYGYRTVHVYQGTLFCPTTTGNVVAYSSSNQTINVDQIAGLCWSYSDVDAYDSKTSEKIQPMSVSLSNASNITYDTGEKRIYIAPKSLEQAKPKCTKENAGQTIWFYEKGTLVHMLCTGGGWARCREGIEPQLVQTKEGPKCFVCQHGNNNKLEWKPSALDACQANASVSIIAIKLAGDVNVTFLPIWGKNACNGTVVAEINAGIKGEKRLGYYDIREENNGKVVTWTIKADKIGTLEGTGNALHFSVRLICEQDGRTLAQDSWDDIKFMPGTVFAIGTTVYIAGAYGTDTIEPVTKANRGNGGTLLPSAEALMVNYAPCDDNYVGLWQNKDDPQLCLLPEVRNDVRADCELVPVFGRGWVALVHEYCPPWYNPFKHECCEGGDGDTVSAVSVPAILILKKSIKYANVMGCASGGCAVVNRPGTSSYPGCPVDSWNGTYYLRAGETMSALDGEYMCTFTEDSAFKWVPAGNGEYKYANTIACFAGFGCFLKDIAGSSPQPGCQVCINSDTCDSRSPGTIMLTWNGAYTCVYTKTGIFKWRPITSRYLDIAPENTNYNIYALSVSGNGKVLAAPWNLETAPKFSKGWARDIAYHAGEYRFKIVAGSCHEFGTNGTYRFWVCELPVNYEELKTCGSRMASDACAEYYDGQAVG